MSKELRLLLIAAVFVPPSLAGCDWFRPGGPPEEALVEVSSEDVDSATLVVSQRFSVGADPGCAQEPDCEAFQLLSADTNVVDLPYRETIKFTSTQRILVQSYPLGEDTARLGMRVVVDGDEKYSEFRRLGPPEEEGGTRETLFFVYTFGRARTPLVQAEVAPSPYLPRGSEFAGLL